MGFRALDDASVRVDAEGSVYFTCRFREVNEPAEPELAEAASAEPEPPSGAAPLDSPPIYHSRSSSTNVLFLDFDGHVISNTQWNVTEGISVWNCLPFDTDGNPDSFSDTEQAVIRRIWERVAEDYAPFNVDVTTEQPVAWNRQTLHALITPGKDASGVSCPHDGYGGYAYVDTFGQARCSYNEANSYSPAWIAIMSNYSYANTAEAAAHELGHNLGLSHDGTSTNEYYKGHSNSSISWAPIMGTAYGRNVSQWSKGEYYDASQSQDDLALLAQKLTYLPDDFGGTAATAGELSTDSGAFSVAARIETSGDRDRFRFTAIRGTLSVTAAVYRCDNGTWGGNADVLLSLYDAAGTLLATNNPALDTRASLSYALPGGTYFLQIEPVGVGSPMNNPPSGYTVYGSLGACQLAGRVPLPDADGDALPDSWEQLYFGGKTAANAGTDSDADGAVNFSEYVAGTVPVDENSVFLLSAPQRVATDPGGFVVSWNAVTGRVYSVHHSGRLSDGFLPLATNIFWPQTAYTDTVHAAQSEGFYRIEVRLAE
jgi:hypothetical protein